MTPPSNVDPLTMEAERHPTLTRSPWRPSAARCWPTRHGGQRQIMAEVGGVVSILPPSRFEPRLRKVNEIRTDGGKGKKRGPLSSWATAIVGALGSES
jgi:hypothetical protein